MPERCYSCSKCGDRGYTSKRNFCDSCGAPMTDKAVDMVMERLNEMEEMKMGLVEYAKSELARISRDEDGMQNMINKDILNIVEMFSEQGHSGTSASYALSALERLLRFKPLTPLTGEDDEWNEILNGTQQNKRCSSVFRNADGTAYDIDGIIVSDNGGITWFSSGRFRKKITFPYTPLIHAERVYIEYTKDVPPGFTGDEYEIITDDPVRIKALYERKRREFDENK